MGHVKEDVYYMNCHVFSVK